MRNRDCLNHFKESRNKRNEQSSRQNPHGRIMSSHERIILNEKVVKLHSNKISRAFEMHISVS